MGVVKINEFTWQLENIQPLKKGKKTAKRKSVRMAYPPPPVHGQPPLFGAPPFPIPPAGMQPPPGLPLAPPPGMPPCESMNKFNVFPSSVIHCSQVVLHACDIKSVLCTMVCFN